MAIKAFVTFLENGVGIQNSFTYDVATWDESTETYGTTWQSFLALGTDIVAPYNNKRIYDAVVTQATAVAAGMSVTLLPSSFVFQYGPQQAANGNSYEGTTQRVSSFPIFKSATVASGAAVFHLTDTGLSGGTALFPNGVIADSVNVTVSDATASYQMSWAFTNSNKTLTITANKLTTANILTGLLGQAQANSAVIKLSIWGY